MIWQIALPSSKFLYLHAVYFVAEQLFCVKWRIILTDPSLKVAVNLLLLYVALV